jgi:predicted acetyltransferase
MDITLRPVTADELPAFMRASGIAFGSVGNDEDAEFWAAGVVVDRTIAAFDAEAIVGTAAAFSFELTVPGGALVPTAGVTMVGVHPTHRRRGLLVRMMEEQLADVAARGEPLAVLIASESAIYGRFGYGLATFATFWQLPTDGTLFTGAQVGGRFRLLDRTEAADVIPGLYDTARKRHVGEVSRPNRWWDRVFSEHQMKKHPQFVVVHESAEGALDGFACYRVKDDWSGGIARNTLEVNELYALDDDVETALWQFLVDVDLVATVKAFARPLDEPMRWRLGDPRRLQVSQMTDHLWVRVVDPATALGARTYATDDRIVVELTDAFVPGNEGRWAIEPGSASRTTDDADLALSAAELGSLYLGGVSASTLARAARITELVPGALARADRMFTVSPAPWCRTDF